MPLCMCMYVCLCVSLSVCLCVCVCVRVLLRSARAVRFACTHLLAMAAILHWPVAWYLYVLTVRLLIMFGHWPASSTILHA